MIYDSKDLYIRKCFLILLILIMMSSILKLVEWFKTLRIEIRQYQIVPQRLHFRKFFGDLVNFFFVFISPCDITSCITNSGNRYFLL